MPSLPDTLPNFLITAKLSLDVTKIESLKVRLERSRLLSLNLNPQNDPVISMEPARKLSSSRSRDSHLQFVELLINYRQNNCYSHTVKIVVKFKLKVVFCLFNSVSLMFSLLTV